MRFDHGLRLQPLWLFIAGLATVSPVAVGSFASCVGIVGDAERLACYDAAAGRQPSAALPPAAQDVFAETPDTVSASTVQGVDHVGKRWAFDSAHDDDLFKLRRYRPIYLLPVTKTSRRNSMPTSPSSGHTLSAPVDLESVEAKYQISFKTRLLRDIWGDNGDLWFGYTQSARWQVYNHGLSAPFRETNYEPEAMLVFEMDQPVLGWRARMLGVGINHQSNGRSLPLSRSWNRIVGEVALQRGDWILALRPWWRIPERASEDDNPDISDHIGRAEVALSYLHNGHQLTLQARHGLRSGPDVHGSVRLGWSFPIAGRLKGYVELFSGYGESLIDYNHRQTMIGAGVTLSEW